MNDLRCRFEHVQNLNVETVVKRRFILGYKTFYDTECGEFPRVYFRINFRFVLPMKHVILQQAEACCSFIQS